MQDLTYTVKSHHNKKVELSLLTSVSGFFASGQMSALVSKPCSTQHFWCRHLYGGAIMRRFTLSTARKETGELGVFHPAGEAASIMCCERLWEGCTNMVYHQVPDLALIPESVDGCRWGPLAAGRRRCWTCWLGARRLAASRAACCSREFAPPPCSCAATRDMSSSLVRAQ